MSILPDFRLQVPQSMAKMVLLVLLAGGSVAAQAVPITGLFNTGVDDFGVALSAGSDDSHYSIVSPAQAAKVINDAIPGSWIPNTSSRRWIWQNANGTPTNTTLTIRTTFDLSGLDAGTAVISGLWATDNFGLDILINGLSTGNTCGGFSVFCGFSVASGFVSGINTLDFVVQDVGSISGLLVGSISGSADAVAAPEPATLLLLVLGLTAIGTRRWQSTIS